MVTTLELYPRGLVLAGTNLHTRPNPGQTNTDYAVLSNGGGGNTLTLSQVGTGGKVGKGYERISSSAVNTGPGQVYLGPAVTITPSTVYTVGFWVYASASCTIRAQTITYTGAGGTGTGTNVFGNEVAVPSSTWTFVSTTFTSNSVAISMRVLLYIATGSTASGRTFDVDQVSVAVGAAAADFTGATPAAGGAHYFWLGTEYQAASEKDLDDPDTTSAAIFTLGARLEWEQRTIVHDAPGATDPPVSVLPAGPRSGRLRFLFSERETARRAEIIHTRPGIITLTDADWPGSPMTYVAQGTLVSELDPDTRVLWVIETEFKEVSS